jgi:hypothetical protein
MSDAGGSANADVAEALLSPGFTARAAALARSACDTRRAAALRQPLLAQVDEEDGDGDVEVSERAGDARPSIGIEARLRRLSFMCRGRVSRHRAALRA